MKKIFNLFIIICMSFLLTSCNFDQLFRNNNINTNTLNYISTVVINSNLKIETETFKALGIPGPFQGSGSGVIIKKENNDYYILTNYHVVYLSEEYDHKYTIEDIYNNRSKATLIAKSEEHDLAILKFVSIEDIEVMELADSDPNVGDLVFSIGSPSGKHNIITAGNIIGYQNIENVDYKVIIHDAIIRNGSSGSMLINEKYEIVGLNTWGFVDTETIDDYVIGGATPVEKIIEFLEIVKFKI